MICKSKLADKNSDYKMYLNEKELFLSTVNRNNKSPRISLKTNIFKSSLTPSTNDSNNNNAYQNNYQNLKENK